MLLGLDIGGTKCVALVGTEAGEVIERVEWPSDVARGPGAMIADLLRHAGTLRARHAVTAVGVAVGGPMDGRRGVVLGPPNLPGWDEVPLSDRLSAALGLPVRVEHDAAACALAEQRWGVGRGCGGVAYLTCGTGFGLGLVFDGRPHYGAGGHSLELGHVRLADHGPVGFGKAGSVEGFCAGASLPKLSAWLRPDRFADAPPDGPRLVELRAAGDVDAAAVLDRWAVSVGRVAAGVADSLFPDVIVLGTLAGRLGMIDLIRASFAAEVHPNAATRCRLELAGLGERLQDCSALAAATG